MTAEMAVFLWSMKMLVSRIIEMSLKQLGILAAGESVQGEELSDALITLEGLLAQWATNRLLVHKAQEITIPLSRGTGIYTVGIQPDYTKYEVVYDDVLPDVDASIKAVSDIAWLDDKQIQMRRDTNSAAHQAMVIYTVDEPYWLFNVKESRSNLMIKAFTLPTQLKPQDELVLSDVYLRPLTLTLALELAPLFGVEPTQMLLMNQRQAVEILKRSNVTPLYTKNDLPVGIGRHECY
jgi:hypothetical protein